MQPIACVHHFLENSAARYPDKVAVVDADRRETYADINMKADCLAACLQDFEVLSGDRVVMLCENSAAYVISYYAILKAGAVVVSLSTDVKPHTLGILLAELQVKAVIASSRFERLLHGMNWQDHQVRALLIANPKLAWSGKPVNVHDWQQCKAVRGTLPVEPQTKRDSLASIIYTSGSTGKPKGVMLTHGNIVANTRSICTYLELTHEDIQMVVLPFFYVMGKSLLNTHFCTGGTVVLNNRFAFTANVLNQMKSEQVTGFSGVPSTYAYLLHRSPLRKFKHSMPSLRYCAQAGGHMPRKIKEELLSVLPDHTRLFIMYGATEASARLTYLPPEKLPLKIDSVGIPIPGVKMFVADPQGRPLPDYQQGELVAMGGNIMQGYWRAPHATKRALKKSVYWTGDIGYRDEEGFFFVTGRKDGLLKVGGHRINPREIEDALIATGLMVETIVLGVKDPLLGNRLVALCVARENELEDRMVLEKCAALLPHYKVPSQVLFIRALPKNSSGKVDKEKCLALIRQIRSSDPVRHGHGV